MRGGHARGWRHHGGGGSSPRRCTVVKFYPHRCYCWKRLGCRVVSAFPSAPPFGSLPPSTRCFSQLPIPAFPSPGLLPISSWRCPFVSAPPSSKEAERCLSDRLNSAISAFPPHPQAPAVALLSLVPGCVPIFASYSPLLLTQSLSRWHHQDTSVASSYGQLLHAGRLVHDGAIPAPTTPTRAAPRRSASPRAPWRSF